MYRKAFFQAISCAALAAALTAACGERGDEETEIPSTSADAVEQETEDTDTMTGDPADAAAAGAGNAPETRTADAEPAGDGAAGAAEAAPAGYREAADLRAAGATGAADAEGAYEEGDLSALWTAWFDEEGNVLKVVEDQSLGEYGGSRVEIVYDDSGQPLRFTETGERVLADAEPAGGVENFSKTLYFEDGELVGGQSDQDGSAGQPEEREIFAASQLALDAKERALASQAEAG